MIKKLLFSLLFLCVAGTGTAALYLDGVNPSSQFGSYQTAGGFRTGTTVISSCTGAITIDWSTEAWRYTCALSGNVTSITLSGFPANEWAFVLEFTDDGTPRTVAYPAAWKEQGGSAMVITTGGVDTWFIDGTTSNIFVSEALDWQ